MKPSRDDDLIVRAKRGDEAAWRELYASNAGRLTYWLRRRPCGDVAADADDIAADAWMTAAHRIASFSGNASEFAGWLFQIARMISANAHRKSARRATTPVAVDDESALWGASADGCALVDGADWTGRLISTLPRREAEVVLCLDVLELDVAATSTALGISRAAVRVSHHRGLCRLREVLKPTRAEPAPRHGRPDATDEPAT